MKPKDDWAEASKVATIIVLSKRFMACGAVN